VKDFLETDKFELNSKRFYAIAAKKKDPENISLYKAFGRVLGKAIYDGQLVPAYLISPVFKQLLQIKLTFDDLEHYNESFFDTFQKLIQSETEVSYSDLLEFWVPEE
jgi:hypothetical protein